MIFEKLEHFVNIGLDLIERIGYLGIFLVSFLENVLTPLPSEAIIPFAGILVSQGRLNLFLVVLAATAGSLAGAYVFYFLGYYLGKTHIRDWIVKWGKYIFISEKDLDRAEAWFVKYEDWAILLCRVIPLVRSFISIPAGYVKMPFWKFTGLTLIGMSVWSFVLVYIGVVLGDSYTQIVPYFRKLDILFGIAIIFVTVFFVYHRFALKSKIARKTNKFVPPPKNESE